MRLSTQHEDLARTSWHDFLELVTNEHSGQDVTMEVLNVDYGDQYEAEKLPLFGIEYDHKDDAVIISVGGRDGRYPVVLRHVIRQPRRIMVNPSIRDAALALDIIDAENVQTIVVVHRQS